MKNILITGGAGFIGSHLVKLLVVKYPNYNIVSSKMLYSGLHHNKCIYICESCNSMLIKD